MSQLAQKLFAVGQLVGHDGANFNFQGGGGSYHGQAPSGQQESGPNPGLSKAAGLLGQSLSDAGGGGATDFSLKNTMQADNTQYGLMGKPQEGLGAGMEYKPQTLSQNPYGLQNTQGLSYQQPSSGWSFFD